MKCLFKRVHIKHPLKHQRKSRTLDWKGFHDVSTPNYCSVMVSDQTVHGLFLKISKHEDSLNSLAKPLHCFTVFMVKVSAISTWSLSFQLMPTVSP